MPFTMLEKLFLSRTSKTYLGMSGYLIAKEEVTPT